MSYIELPTLVPSTKKTVISLWFRVPSTTIATATAQWNAYNNSDVPLRPPLIGIIPLMVFGDANLRQQRWTDLVDTRVIGSSSAYTYHQWNGFGPPDCLDSGYIDGPVWDGHGVQPPFTGAVSIPIIGPVPTPNGNFITLDPSHIGVDCTGAYPALSFNLNFAKGNQPGGEGLFAIVSSENGGPSDEWEEGDGCGGAQPYTYRPDQPFECIEAQSAFTVDTLVDDTGFQSVFLGGGVENIRLLPRRDGGGGGSSYYPSGEASFDGQRVTPDHWHHLLLSFDLSNNIVTHAGVGFVINDNTTYPGTSTIEGDNPQIEVNPQAKRTSSAAHVYVAFDDVNLTGSKLSAYYPIGSSNGNAVLTGLGYAVATTVNVSSITFGPDCFNGNFATITNTIVEQNYALSPAPVPIGTVGFPATHTYFSRVLHVEMGECQMFLDVSVDTATDIVRRAFVTDNGKPAPIGEAEKLMGKKPEVLVHRAQNWKNGRNTGTIANTPPDDGVHVGVIKTYIPNPNLFDDQGQPQ